MAKLIRNQKDIEYGVNSIIERYLWVKNKISKTSAYSLNETKERLELIIERDILDEILRQLDIQDFELDKDNNEFTIN
jgi:hypothetical protein